MTRLIYDLGMHTGQDTAFYLAKGFDVLAVEANPQLAQQGEHRFQQAIADGRLTILNVGVGDKEGTFPFYVNATYSEWSSFDKDIGSRGGCKEILDIPMLRFDTLIERHGVPHYLKIDIEGHDFIVLQRLELTEARPAYISVENGLPHMLTHLAGMGYTGFKFINQAEVPRMQCPSPAREGNDIAWQFRLGASGPFGEETVGHWKAVDEVLKDITAYWDTPQLDANVHGWYDLHAKR